MNTSQCPSAGSSPDAVVAQINGKVDTYYSHHFFQLALKQETIGLSRFTPLGVGCSWFSDPAEWICVANSCEKRLNSGFYSVLDSLVHNIYEEQRYLAQALRKPNTMHSPDVISAFQDTNKITRSYKKADRRIRLSHMMTCLVDRLLWASSGETNYQSGPVQFPHLPYPDDSRFNEYSDFMQRWPQIVFAYSDALGKETSTEDSLVMSTHPVLSLYYTSVTSSKSRYLNTVLDNISRCALGLRALCHVSISLSV
jgi:hypothetical protein